LDRVASTSRNCGSFLIICHLPVHTNKYTHTTRRRRRRRRRQSRWFEHKKTKALSRGVRWVWDLDPRATRKNCTVSQCTRT
jgi:hypothetical protein